MEENNGNKSIPTREEIEKALSQLGLELKPIEKSNENLEKGGSVAGLVDVLESMNNRLEALENAESDVQISDDIVKGIVDEVVPSLTENLSEQFESLRKGLDDMSENSEDSGSIAELRETVETRLDEMSKSLDEFLSAPHPRKSITTKGYMEKGFSGEEGEDGKTLSLSRDKDRLLSLIDGKAGDLSKGERNEFNDAAVDLESTGFISKEIIQKLEESEGIKIIL